MLQPPQLAGSVCVVAHPPAQQVWPTVQAAPPVPHWFTQAPETHAWAAAQRIPHWPQFVASLVTSLHPLLQHDSPALQAGPPAQVPAQIAFTHALPFGHAFPHAPQFFASLEVSMHPSLPQQVCPTLQLHSGGVEQPDPSGAQHDP
jgi:hypothetical protein